MSATLSEGFTEEVMYLDFQGLGGAAYGTGLTEPPP